ncbi:hypothetical protein J3F84DRAFT_291497 [Trichoderma pleuroticola]
MALHMARIHIDAHICTTPSDLYQKGVARVTQLQAMDVFGIAYCRASGGNMESRIPVSFFVCVVGETGTAEWPGRITPAGVHSSELAKASETRPFADRYCVPIPSSILLSLSR